MTEEKPRVRLVSQPASVRPKISSTLPSASANTAAHQDQLISGTSAASSSATNMNMRQLSARIRNPDSASLTVPVARQRPASVTVPAARGRVIAPASTNYVLPGGGSFVAPNTIQTGVIETVPTATMGVDSNQDGRANYSFTGVDLNHDGIPETPSNTTIVIAAQPPQMMVTQTQPEGAGRSLLEQFTVANSQLEREHSRLESLIEGMQGRIQAQVVLHVESHLQASAKEAGEKLKQMLQETEYRLNGKIEAGQQASSAVSGEDLILLLNEAETRFNAKFAAQREQQARELGECNDVLARLSSNALYFEEQLRDIQSTHEQNSEKIWQEVSQAREINQERAFRQNELEAIAVDEVMSKHRELDQRLENFQLESLQRLRVLEAKESKLPPNALDDLELLQNRVAALQTQLDARAADNDSMLKLAEQNLSVSRDSDGLTKLRQELSERIQKAEAQSQMLSRKIQQSGLEYGDLDAKFLVMQEKLVNYLTTLDAVGPLQDKAGRDFQNLEGRLQEQAARLDALATGQEDLAKDRRQSQEASEGLRRQLTSTADKQSMQELRDQIAEIEKQSMQELRDQIAEIEKIVKSSQEKLGALSARVNESAQQGAVDGQLALDAHKTLQQDFQDEVKKELGLQQAKLDDHAKSQQAKLDDHAKSQQAKLDDLAKSQQAKLDDLANSMGAASRNEKEKALEDAVHTKLEDTVDRFARTLAELGKQEESLEKKIQAFEQNYVKREELASFSADISSLRKELAASVGEFAQASASSATTVQLEEKLGNIQKQASGANEKLEGIQKQVTAQKKTIADWQVLMENLRQKVDEFQRDSSLTKGQLDAFSQQIRGTGDRSVQDGVAEKLSAKIELVQELSAKVESVASQVNVTTEASIRQIVDKAISDNSRETVELLTRMRAFLAESESALNRLKLEDQKLQANASSKGLETQSQTPRAGEIDARQISLSSDKAIAAATSRGAESAPGDKKRAMSQLDKARTRANTATCCFPVKIETSKSGPEQGMNLQEWIDSVAALLLKMQEEATESSSQFKSDLSEQKRVLKKLEDQPGTTQDSASRSGILFVNKVELQDELQAERQNVQREYATKAELRVEVEERVRENHSWNEQFRREIARIMKNQVLQQDGYAVAPDEYRNVVDRPDSTAREDGFFRKQVNHLFPSSSTPRSGTYLATTP